MYTYDTKKKREREYDNDKLLTFIKILNDNMVLMLKKSKSVKLLSTLVIKSNTQL